MRETYKNTLNQKIWDSLRVRSELADSLMANEISQYVKGMDKRRTPKTFGQSGLNPGIYVTTFESDVLSLR